MKEEDMHSNNNADETTKCLSSSTLSNQSSQRSRKYIRKQHLASFLANIPSLSTGIALAWTAPAVPVLLGQVAGDAQPLRLSLEQASWVGAMLPLTSLAGALAAGPLAERVGRKGALLLGAAPTLLGWALMAFAGTSLWLLMVGRALTGFSMGAVSGPAALYCEEIADIRVRGALGTFQFMMNVIGTLWIYGLGCLFTYFWFTAASLLPSLIFVFTFCWMPESPAYLAARGRQQDAHKAMRWFRGPDIDCDMELKKLLASKANTTPSDEPQNISFQTLSSIRPWRSNAFRSVVIVMVTMCLQQLSGVSLFTFYGVQVFQTAGESISANLSCFIMGFLSSLGVLLTTLTVDCLGRRVWLIISFLLMGVCLLCFSIFSYVKNNGFNMEKWTWIPLALVIVFLVSFGVGAGPVPWFLMAEMLPMHAKGWASPLGVCANRITMFLVSKQSPLMLVYAGESVTYAVFSSICFISAVFVKCCIPETRGKQKADILNEIGGDVP